MTVMSDQNVEGKQDAVYKLMKDGRWYDAAQIREVGGSEGLRRMRELRHQGGFSVEKKYLGHGLWAYRLTWM